MRSAASMLGVLLVIVLFTGCPDAGVDGDAVVGQTSYLLSVESLGPGRVTVSPEKSAYSAGETVILSPVPDADSLFTGWDGTLEADANPLELLVDKDYTLRAHFTLKTDDDDGDGIPNYQEDTNRNGCLTDDDTDGDGIPDYLDDDDDGDGILTRDENTGDQDGDGIPDYLESSIRDLDGDGLPDQADPDDDGDGIPTANEDIWPAGGNGWFFDDDTDGDGIINAYDDDDDGDGILTCAEKTGDPNDNGIPAYLDPSE